MKNTLIIIPAYNEEACIKDVAKNVKKIVNADVLAVNDGSKDNTYSEAKAAGVKVLDLPINLGIGGAVQAGYLYAYKNGYDFAFQLDGDGQHDPKYIDIMVEDLKNKEADMIIGSRFIEKTGYEQTFFRKIGNKCISFLIKILTGKKIYDTTSGFRGVNRDIIEIFSRKYPYDYPEPETNMQLILKKKKVKEIPMEMKKRETGKSFVSPFKSIQYMLKVSLALGIVKIRKD